MYRNQYHYYWTDYHFLFTSNYPLTLITGLVLFLFLGGLGGITSSSYWNKNAMVAKKEAGGILLIPLKKIQNMSIVYILN